MKIMYKIILFCLIVSISKSYIACSLMPGYLISDPQIEINETTSVTFEAPQIKKVSISRGSYDQSGWSCSDTGILRITLTEPISEDILSYEIKITSGSMPDNSIPEGFITPLALSDEELSLSFYWLDMPQPNSILEAIDAVLEIRQLTNEGNISEPTYIRVVDLATGG